MRTARAISLLLLLQARRSMTGAELAAELEVSERTVQRDVLALAEAGVPVYADRGRAGGYRLLDGYRTRLTGLDRAEAEVLLLAGLPGPLQDMGLADPALAARLKVTGELGGAPAAGARRFHLDAPGWFRDAPVPPLLAEVARAVWGGRLLRARYRRRPEADPVERVLRPSGLVLKAGTWYLVARPDGTGQEGEAAGHRVYRVDRLLAAEPSDRPFTPDGADADFDLAAFWEGRAADFARSLLRETVTLRLGPPGLALVRRLLEPLAAREALASAGEPDGQGRVTVRLPVESLDVGYEEVLRLGPEAEVLEPPALRQRLAEAAARAAALYGVPPAGRPQR
ncbi:helix-turn-helix transcriptional regulator [Kitasatospora purpeofusca]|uniref:helix-turn-helix transcriptional regulator n=1 Tax=Kitasatospora purpeofusca TaxID=67352 RepID=UPI002A59D274|nr:WYL domain-containing protein [Kitasatospora purpeofusca]MDY0815935.1 WYL domain-containing protein [Kitasatospora purpeofusca]